MGPATPHKGIARLHPAFRHHSVPHNLGKIAERQTGSAAAGYELPMTAERFTLCPDSPRSLRMYVKHQRVGDMSRVRIFLGFGILKFKHKRFLRREEVYREVPVWRFGDYCFVWWPRGR